MRRRSGPVMLGISGVDGSGKSTLAATLTDALRSAGRRPITLYCYGCVFCRRWPGGPRDEHGSRPAAAGGRWGWHWARRWVGSVHVYVDWAELSVRLAGARLAARSVGSSSVIVTDRSPLDGVVKHDPVPGSLAARQYLRLAQRYQTLIWLQGDAQALAERDREHRAVVLQHAHDRFDRLARVLPNVVAINTTEVPADEVLAGALRALRKREEALEGSS